jgi:hypothetical protein
MNLSLDDDDLVARLLDELLRRRGRFFDRHAGDPLGNRNAILPVELFCLILVNVHGARLLGVVSTWCSVSAHVLDDVVAELGTRDGRRSFHETREIVGYALGADRPLHAFDHQVRCFMPAEVTKHHLAAENDR